ncbi:MAG: SIS domain-containing protein [Chloroflexota bacterium]
MLNTTHLYREIHQQPQVIENLLQQEHAQAQALANQIRQRNITHVVIAARGTSDNAARYANYVLGARNGIIVSLATPSLFSIYRQPPILKNALVLGISQSGKSPDIVSVVAEGRRQGALTAAITNFSDSDLAQEADFVLNLQAGLEQSVAATKTYTSELAAIALLSCCLAQEDQAMSALQKMPQLVNETLQINQALPQLTERYRYMEQCVVIGRGFNYATAFELALKLKELTYTMVEPYSSADFLHGPLALIDQGFPVIVVAPSGQMHSEMEAFLVPLMERRAELIVISDSGTLLAQAQTPLQLPSDIPEWLSPVASIVPGQLFAMHLAATRGYSVDQPRGLNKVTETL